MGDLRPDLTPLFRDFGVAATVTPVGGAAIVTTGVWVQARGAVNAIGWLSPAPVVALERHTRLALRRNAVPTLPIGSTIVAPLPGTSTPTPWTVDQVEELDPELWVAMVH